MQNNTGSDSVTEGIHVQVIPEYIPEQSNPELNRFVFAYRVVITNEGDRWAKLLSRHWIIINDAGDREVLWDIHQNFKRENHLITQAQHRLIQSGEQWKASIRW